MTLKTSLDEAMMFMLLGIGITIGCLGAFTDRLEIEVKTKDCVSKATE